MPTVKLWEERPLNHQAENAHLLERLTEQKLSGGTQ